MLNILITFFDNIYNTIDNKCQEVRKKENLDIKGGIRI